MSNYAGKVVATFPDEIKEPHKLEELIRLRDASVHFYYQPTNTIYSTSFLFDGAHKADELQNSTKQIRMFNNLPAYQSASSIAK